MQCDKVKDILITDYIDNELEANARLKIEEHLSRCSSCKAFKEDLLNITIEPLKGVKEAIPPEFIWSRIKNSLEEQKAPKNSLNFAGLLSFLRPQWINVSVISLIFTFTLIIGNLFAHDIWSTRAQNHVQASIEVSNNIELGVFNDTPGEETENASNIIGG